MTRFQSVWRLATAALIGIGLLVTAFAAAAEGDDALSLPRFVSVKSDRANVRTGPDRRRYPIAWVFVKKGVPVEITGEYEDWRKIKDLDGAEGWMHESLLSPDRYAIVTGGQRAVYLQPDSGSRTVYFAESGVTGRLDRCLKDWCELTVDGNTGWIPKTQIWGARADETFE